MIGLTELNLLVEPCQAGPNDVPTKKSDIKSQLEQVLVDGNADLALLYLRESVFRLTRFIEANFTGFIDQSSVSASCNGIIEMPDRGNAIHSEKQFIIETLTIDGYAPPAQTQCLDDFLVAYWILIDFGHFLTNLCPTVYIWAIRSLFLLQRCLEKRSNTIKKEIFQRLDTVSHNLIDKFNALGLNIKGLLYAEWSYIYWFFFDYKSSQQCIQHAQSFVGVDVCLTGKMGKKTKFQVKNVAQLVADVSQKAVCQIGKSLDVEEMAIRDKNLPIDCSLEDDTLLNRTEFLDVETGPQKMTVSQQCVILATLNFNRKKKARDAMSLEESIAYLDVLLADPKNWCVQRAALIARCKLEIDSRRRFERCLKQLEQLVNDTNKENLESGIVKKESIRTNLAFFACNLPSKRQVERLLGDAMFKFGAVRPALEVFMRLELWSQVIQCYRSLNLLDRAESLIRQRLDEEPENYEFWTLLGDVTGNTEHFERAWDLSHARYAPAQHRMGVLLCSRQKYAQAAEALEKATVVQPLLVKAWFTLGHCAAQLADYSKAAKAYHRYVALEPDHFEAWNNLADVYLNMGQKSRAYSMLQEALRCEYDNWKLWDNVALISIDLGRFDETLQHLHRLLDIKPKYYDPRLLDRLTQGIVKKCSVIKEKVPNSEPHDETDGGDENGVLDPERLISNARKFFGRLTSTVTNDPELWRMYADLYCDQNLTMNSRMTNDQTGCVSSLENCANFYRRAFNCARQQTSWQASDCKARSAAAYVLKLGLHYVEAELRLSNLRRIKNEKFDSKTFSNTNNSIAEPEFASSEQKSDSTDAESYHNVDASVRLSVKPFLVALRKHFESHDGEICDELRTDYNTLCRLLGN